MNPEVKKSWLEALRSGEYNQGRGKLRNIDEQFCCLGVLCDLYIKQHPSETWTMEEGYYSFGDYSGVPTMEVQQWADIDSTRRINGEKSLIDFNDTGMPFSEIADLIEKHL